MNGFISCMFIANRHWLYDDRNCGFHAVVFLDLLKSSGVSLGQILRSVDISFPPSIFHILFVNVLLHKPMSMYSLRLRT